MTQINQKACLKVLQNSAVIAILLTLRLVTHRRELSNNSSLVLN